MSRPVKGAEGRAVRHAWVAAGKPKEVLDPVSMRSDLHEFDWLTSGFFFKRRMSNDD